ncbi:MAG: tRNA lysidine(34) synthetase TilS [Tissierellia bacterium]|nr:tRNA lysidine(34) synthetase TilS [Tissierellia bacterium]
MYEAFVEQLIQTRSIVPGDRVVLGVSGGVDSMVMLDLFHRLQDQWELSLVIAHINHLTRGTESDGDEALVKRIAEQLGHPFALRRESMPKMAQELKISEEDAGRRIRYGFFQELVMKQPGTLLCVAHNQDDQVETILLNILRGTGLEGLCGMQPQSGHLLRPLLHFSRAQIEAYADEKEVAYREDSSNQSNDYRRNALRNQLLPQLREQFNPAVDQALLRLSEHARGELEILESWTQSTMEQITKGQGEDFIEWDLQGFRSLSSPEQQRLIRFGITQLMGSTKGFDSVHIEEFLRTAKRKTGKQTSLGGLQLYVESDTLRLFVQRSQDGPKSISIPPPHTGCYDYGKFKICIRRLSLEEYRSEFSSIPKNIPKNMALFDGDSFQTELIIRPREPGDRMQIDGMKGHKKLKELFIDAKVPASQRATIPIFELNHAIIWVGGLRRCETNKLSEESEEVILLEIHEGEKH